MNYCLLYRYLFALQMSVCSLPKFDIFCVLGGVLRGLAFSGAKVGKVGGYLDSGSYPGFEPARDGLTGCRQ